MYHNVAMICLFFERRPLVAITESASSKTNLCVSFDQDITYPTFETLNMRAETNE